MNHTNFKDVKAELTDTHTMMREHTYKGIPGVLKVTSSQGDHPKVAVSAMTHGNEPSGLATIRYFLENDRLKNLLDQGTGGSVYFMLNNIDAAALYFALDKDATEKEKLACRNTELNTNMNRLPEDILTLNMHDSRSEVRRTLELYPLLCEMNAGIDIHSVSNSNLQMIMDVKGSGLEFAKRFPIQNVITNMIPVQIGHPISALYGGKDQAIPVVGIEAGQHEDPAACNYAIECTRQFLMSLGVIPFSSAYAKAQHDLREYRISKYILPLKDTCTTVREFTMFEQITHDTILLGNEHGEQTTAGMDGHVLFAPPPERVIEAKNEEACFISEPVKINAY